MGIDARNPPWYITLPTAVMGNVIPILVLVNAMDKISSLAMNFPTSIGRLINWYTERLQRV